MSAKGIVSNPFNLKVQDGACGVTNRLAGEKKISGHCRCAQPSLRSGQVLEMEHV